MNTVVSESESSKHGQALVQKPGKQRTLAQPAEVEGVGFVTGADVRVVFRPADANVGYVFVRTDLPGHPRIAADVEHVVERRRRTALAAGGVTVEMTEHLLAALAGLGIDNCLIELNAGEAPGMDGSALPFVEKLLEAGIVTLDVPRRPLVIDEPYCVSEGDAVVAIHPGPSDRMDITFTLDYGARAGMQRQSLMLSLSPETFRDEIAAARTFVLEEEIAALKASGLGSRTTAKDLLVLVDQGKPIDNAFRFPDECVRHKILDVIGDLALFGRPVCGHVLAHKSGHQLNTALVRHVNQTLEIRQQTRVLEGKPLLDSIQIEKIIPHRYPFLLVDRVLELDANRRAVGIKNVSYNEPFFQGHWPGRPVMPGVLIVEAMAQLAGIMLTQWQQTGLYAMIISMNGIKLRKPVIPGDQLWLESEAVRVKSRTAVLKTCAKVNRELVAEAQMSFVLITGDDEKE